ncbi:MAG: glycoside hydrolase family 65 protein [Anaerobacillus sp.]|uniref:glycoside hydrolase family 65 protein n=1 Tax=Anaerobacillus sp. TaxID=1872506 RepID=UPI00391D06AE
MTWKIRNNELGEQQLLVNESLFFNGNGYLGVRGNFEEGYNEDLKSIRGTYINAFHDIIDITYGEKLHAFPETQQKLLNVIDAQSIELRLGDDQEPFSLFTGEVLSYERTLHMDKGYSERIVHWRSPKGKEVKLTIRRLVSFVHPELFTIDYKITPVNFHGKLTIISTVNGDVSNFVDPNDPRVASGHAKRLKTCFIEQNGEFSAIVNEAQRSRLRVACVTNYLLPKDIKREDEVTERAIKTILTTNLIEEINVTKVNILTDTLRHEDVITSAYNIHEQIANQNFETMLAEQKHYLDDFWKYADIEINGDEALQQGIRFNLYHLLQSVGKDRYSNIAAKGLSGEGYEGHYFWDTEIYIFPVFLMTNPSLAKNLLLYRYSILDGARARAKEMGHSKGALFPWRTISGTECSAYYPAGTAQYHISADIAYSYIQYYLATKDEKFLQQFGAEVLFETARLWIDVGHYYNGQFRIDAVTGPDEYTCIVNNNYYTNVMAKYNLHWAGKVFELLQEQAPDVFAALSEKLQLSESEHTEWINASSLMYLPYNSELDLNPQDDTFLQKAVWDFEQTKEDQYPLLLHYHPLTLYRYQVCKQADTVLAHFLLEDEQSIETIRNSYHYYEKITTHDSSLSSCVFSIMAAKLNEQEKAYDYFTETARLDIDNTHGNTKDGLHMANMGGTWLAIVYGFAGVRLKEAGLFLAPSLPTAWSGYCFSMYYQGSGLKISIDAELVEIELIEGSEVTVHLYDNEVTVTTEPIKVQLRR